MSHPTRISAGPREGTADLDHPIAPTVFLKGRSAAETRSTGAEAPVDHETVTCDPQEEDTPTRSRRPAVGRRLPVEAYPRTSSKNLSQRPVIHRPHPHHKHEGLRVSDADTFAPGWERDCGDRPPPGPECTSAHSAKGK